MLVILLATLLLQDSTAAKMTLGTALPIVEVDTGKLKGDLARLAWSPDGSEFYIQTIERDGRGNIKSSKHYVVSSTAKTVKSVDQEPAWASKYWTWKSGQQSPGSSAFKISVDTKQETVRSTAAPAGGALAKGGGADPTLGTTVADAASAADTTQLKTTYALKLKSETIGEWINEAVMPGVNFSWAPAPMSMIVFAKRDGGPLVVMDEGGRKQELVGAKAALLPAWSNNGSQIAWLERKDKKKYQLMVAEIASR